MKNLFEPATVAEVKSRVNLLTPANRRLWGTMSVAQMLEHCSIGFEFASGHTRPPRMLMGRILGPVIKPLALKDDAPMRRNSPTAPILVIQGEPQFVSTKTRLLGLIDGFATGGAAGCTDHPHIFFGRLNADEWAILMYKHVDHHLRQFSA